MWVPTAFGLAACGAAALWGAMALADWLGRRGLVPKPPELLAVGSLALLLLASQSGWNLGAAESDGALSALGDLSSLRAAMTVTALLGFSVVALGRCRLR